MIEMKTLTIRIYGDPVLRSKSEPVSNFDSGLHDLLDAMTETMVRDQGVGLAAQQVGVTDSVMVVNPDPPSQSTLLQMVNPRILDSSGETSSMEEGCLSFPGIRGNIARPVSIEVEYFDRNGHRKVIRDDGLVSRIIQHEYDHLNGILFIDRMSVAKRMLLKPKLIKLKKIGSGEK